MIGRPKFLNKTITTKRDFLNAPDINTRGAKTNTNKTDIQETGKEEKTIETKWLKLNCLSLFSNVKTFERGKLKYYYENGKKIQQGYFHNWYQQKLT